jgi:hypothetical protein
MHVIISIQVQVQSCIPMFFRFILLKYTVSEDFNYFFSKFDPNDLNFGIELSIFLLPFILWSESYNQRMKTGPK